MNTHEKEAAKAVIAEVLKILSEIVDPEVTSIEVNIPFGNLNRRSVTLKMGQRGHLMIGLYTNREEA